MSLNVIVLVPYRDGRSYRARIIGYNLHTGRFLAQYIEGPWDGGCVESSRKVMLAG